MIEKAREAVEAMKEVLDIFSKMELPIEEHYCTLDYEATTAIIHGFQQLERERDTAVGLVKELGTCNYCKHDSFCPHTIPNCMNCKDIRCPCYSCGNQSNWEWCGIQEVE